MELNGTVTELFWTGVDHRRLEHATVTLDDEGMRATGVQLGTDPAPYELVYRLSVGVDWRTRLLEVEVTGQRWRRELRLGRSDEGEWSIEVGQEGEPPGLAEPGGDPASLGAALDCDLGRSPLTNTMPIRRLLDGTHDPERELVMAWVEVPSLRVVAARQRYRLGAAGQAEYVGTHRGYRGTLRFDEQGFVREYPGLAVRLDQDDARSRGAEFVDADLSGARFNRVDLSGAVLRGVDVAAAEIDAPWLSEDGSSLRVNGVDVVPLVEAELDRRFPGRADRRAADPEALRTAWAALERAWSTTLARVASMPPGTEDVSVEGEWSFAQTLRHLVMATDIWLGRAVLGREQPFHPLGLPHAEYETDGGDMSVFATGTPAYADVLEARADRVALVRDFLAHVSAEDLAAPRRNPHAPENPETTLSCLHVILQEEWEHHRFAVRDLDAIEAATRGRWV